VLKIRVWTFLCLIFIVVFALSATNVVHAATQLAIPPTISVGSSPEYVAYDSGMGEIFVTNEGDNSVSVISDSSNSVVATIPVGEYPTGVVYDLAKGEIFVSNGGANTVSVISDSTNAVIATIDVGASPKCGAYDPAKGEIFVPNFDGNTVSVISDATNMVVATVTVGQGAMDAVYDPGKGEIFVSNEEGNTVSVISDSTNNVVATINVGGNAPEGLAYVPDKGEIFAADYDAGSFFIIQDSDNTMVTPVQLQGYSGDPTGMVYDSAKDDIFLTCYTGTVFVIAASNNAVLAWAPMAQLPVTDGSFGPLPTGIAYDSAKGELFVADSGSNAVSIIQDSSIASAVSSTSSTSTGSSGSSNDTLFIIIGALIAIIVIGIAGYMMFAGRRARSVGPVESTVASASSGSNVISGNPKLEKSKIIAEKPAGQAQQGQKEPVGQPDVRGERFRRLVRTFKEKGAISPEKAMTAEQLGLPQQFDKYMENRKVPIKVFVEVSGKYYLDEKALEEMRRRMAKK
jgi:YVTN family beta-propeller protein